jgi:hypothetical protein
MKSEQNYLKHTLGTDLHFIRPPKVSTDLLSDSQNSLIVCTADLFDFLISLIFWWNLLFNSQKSSIFHLPSFDFQLSTQFQ